MTKAGKFVYDKKPMMKTFLERSFPLAIAILSFIFYQVLYQPILQSLEMAASVLLFFTTLAWSALIFLSLERCHWLRYLYALSAIFLSVLLVDVICFFPENLLFQRLLYGFNLLGIAIIEFYLRISHKEQDNHHD